MLIAVLSNNQSHICTAIFCAVGYCSDNDDVVVTCWLQGCFVAACLTKACVGFIDGSTQAFAAITPCANSTAAKVMRMSNLFLR